MIWESSLETALITLLMNKIEWLVANLIANGSPARSECEHFSVILDLFGPLLWSGSHLVIWESTLEL